MRLEAVPPFNFRATVLSHGWCKLAPFLWDEERRTLSRVEHLSSGQVVKLAMREDYGSAEGVVVDITSESSLTPTEMAEARKRVSWILRLDEDLKPFHEVCRGEPALTHVAKEGKGRILRSPSLFEDVIKAICCCNMSWAGTVNMVNRLVGALGQVYPPDPLLHAFPSAEAVAAVDEGYLREVARLGYRAPYVLALARRSCDGSFDLEGLKGDELEASELRRRLRGIKGLGEYSTALVLTLLGRYDYVPIDVWTRKMVSERFFRGQAVSDAQVKEVFEPWGRFRALAYWFWE